MAENRMFWLVWTPGTVPSYRHGSRKSAQGEAERLAAANQGVSFYVLEAKSVSRQEPQPTLTTDLDSDDVPF